MSKLKGSCLIFWRLTSLHVYTFLILSNYLSFKVLQHCCMTYVTRAYLGHQQRLNTRMITRSILIICFLDSFTLTALLCCLTLLELLTLRFKLDFFSSFPILIEVLVLSLSLTSFNLNLKGDLYWEHSYYLVESPQILYHSGLSWFCYFLWTSKGLQLPLE